MNMMSNELDKQFLNVNGKKVVQNHKLEWIVLHIKVTKKVYTPRRITKKKKMSSRRNKSIV